MRLRHQTPPSLDARKRVLKLSLLRQKLPWLDSIFRQIEARSPPFAYSSTACFGLNAQHRIQFVLRHLLGFLWGIGVFLLNFIAAVVLCRYVVNMDSD